jgi:hypothetical protein
MAYMNHINGGAGSVATLDLTPYTVLRWLRGTSRCVYVHIICTHTRAGCSSPVVKVCSVHTTGSRLASSRAWLRVSLVAPCSCDVLNRNHALESRALVGYVVALSALALGLQRLHRTAAARSLRARIFGPEEQALNANYVPAGGYVARHGGPAILFFQFARVAANVALAVLSLVTYLSSRSEGVMVITAAAVSVFRYVCSHA